MCLCVAAFHVVFVLSDLGEKLVCVGEHLSDGHSPVPEELVAFYR